MTLLLFRRGLSGFRATAAGMPHALIEVADRWTADDEIRIIDAVHGALIAAFRIPPGDKHVRLIAHAAHRFGYPPDLAHPEMLTLVSIDCFADRSVDAKRSLYREIVQRLDLVGVPPDHLSITLRESPAENCGIRGGQAACDVELGFDVTV